MMRGGRAGETREGGVPAVEKSMELMKDSTLFALTVPPACGKGYVPDLPRGEGELLAFISWNVD